MSPRALVTGAGGFVGRHLVAVLGARGHEVVGVTRPRSSRARSTVAAAWIEADLLDAESVLQVVKEVRPQFVYHLAALMPGASLEELVATNVMGTRNLLEALVRAGERVEGVVVAGSASEYGPVSEAELPVTERQPLAPLSPYGLSKAAQSLLVQQYHLRHALPVVRTRCFNLLGPGEPPSQVAGAFARQIAQIESGAKSAELCVGNLSGERDFLDVRDAARGLVELCERGRGGSVYNLCSGRPLLIGSILAELLDRARVPVRVVQDPALVAEREVSRIYGDPARAQRETGWRAEISLQESIRDLLTYWREKVGSAEAEG
ncbi:GDP-mannose 4,6-dehydratase [Geomonas sp. RF6]|uniref:GDP-mannose 4,6-dehydratase n=1 Tax=Geomonas sp. RF6 TaxID=2897342 RepID=UPI001E2B4FEA|nr:GDP-mannose 4,6-dehydratase [Geomonas sp. RF6]UFS69348.1 GDP-mannose 4,6-dehydratase [Geomonas sp. RF6]